MFLDPTIAAKIGLIEVKVVEKTRKEKNLEKEEEGNKKYEMILDGFNERMDLYPQHSSILEAYPGSSQDATKHK